jgi:hypothetical protein
MSTTESVRKDPGVVVAYATSLQKYLSLIFDMLLSLFFHFSYKTADSSGGSGEAPFEGVEICNFNLVSNLIPSLLLS